LYPGASESVSQVQKPQIVRSQCQNEYWIPDLGICVNDCPDGYFSGSYLGNFYEYYKYETLTIEIDTF
jgi:hypothetical protein